MAPLVIGFTVFLAHAALVPLTGCGINPARSFGPSLVNSFANNDTWKQYTWIYYIGPMVGSILCAFVTNAIYVEKDDKKKPKAETDARKFARSEETTTGFRSVKIRRTAATSSAIDSGSKYVSPIDEEN